MGAWADLKLDTKVLKGLAEQLLTNRQSRAFDSALVTAERTNAAKGLVEDKLLDNKVGDLACYVDDFGGFSKMLDAIASQTSLSGHVQRALAHAFLHNWSNESRTTRDGLLSDSTEFFEKRLDTTVRALARLAPYALEKRSTAGSTGGGAFASVMDTYDC